MYYWVATLLPYLYQEVSAVRRAFAILVLVLSALLAGCSDDGTSQKLEPTHAMESTPTSAAPTSEPTCEGQDCSGQEVTETDCDEGIPQTVGERAEITSGPNGVRGVLALRMADPATCANIYWAHFVPYGDSERWKVSILVEGQPKETQKSVVGDPTITGYTEGVYAEPGTDIEYCVGVGERSACLTYKAA